MKRILILGIDGYIGYALALDLMEKGYEVCGVDNLSRRRLVEFAGSDSLVPISPISQRIRYLRGLPNYIDSMACINLGDHYLIKRILKEYKPDVIVHLAEQPSAPWSMRSVRSAIDTQVFNISGTLAQRLLVHFQSVEKVIKDIRISDSLAIRLHKKKGRPLICGIEAVMK